MVEGRREKVFYAASGGEGWREKFTYRAKTMPAFTLQRSGATLVTVNNSRSEILLNACARVPRAQEGVLWMFAPSLRP